MFLSLMSSTVCFTAYNSKLHIMVPPLYLSKLCWSLCCQEFVFLHTHYGYHIHLCFISSHHFVPQLLTVNYTFLCRFFLLTYGLFLQILPWYPFLYHTRQIIILHTVLPIACSAVECSLGTLSPQLLNNQLLLSLIKLYAPKLSS